MFGAACTVGCSPVNKIGSRSIISGSCLQAAANRWRWWAAVVGPGWILVGMAKMLGAHSWPFWFCVLNH